MEWQPIETAPKDGTPALFYERNTYDYEIHLGYYDKGSWWNNLFEPYRFYPTHWMPLPEPPKKD
jgi:hypothetical protein